jgi:hypothetical protein
MDFARILEKKDHIDPLYPLSPDRVFPTNGINMIGSRLRHHIQKYFQSKGDVNISPKLSDPIQMSALTQALALATFSVTVTAGTLR